MIGSVVALVLVVGGSIAYDMNKQSKIDAANTALSLLQKDPKDSTSLAQLKALSPNLHDVWLYSQAIVDKNVELLAQLQSSKALIVSDLITYELAQNKKDISALNSYAMKQSSIYKDLAQVQSAVMLINSGEIKQAHDKLSTITESSSLYRVAKALLHYGVK
jgi:hypothetical protein